MGKQIVVICARGGSKGIPWKNFQSPFQDLSPYQVLRYKLEKSIISDIPSYVSSDSDEILDLASASGFTPLKRPDNLSHSSSRIVEVLLHVKHQLSLHDTCQVIQISAVAPFISVDSINQLAQLGSTPGESVLSVTQFFGNSHPALAGECVDNEFKYLYDEYPRYPRQCRKSVYYPNGCLFSRTAFNIRGDITTNDMPSSPRAVIMTHPESLNMDDINDWNLALLQAKTFPHPAQ